VRARIIVPCYSEALRLDTSAFLALVDACLHVDLLFVDDGSPDDTGDILQALVSLRPERLALLSLPMNRGKGEAVRQGLRAALAGSHDVVGYMDADLSTPPHEILRLLEHIQGDGPAVVLAARVALLGSQIRRSALRHYLGRTFASLASLMLSLRVYDTQCGAKLFRRCPALEAALETPFLSSWAFDVELLGRLLTGAPATPPLDVCAFREVPLHAWRDVPGSKLRPAAMAGAVTDLARIRRDLSRRRRLQRNAHG
jgi:glycosyltransferase involved in cell wall biosynthesis